MRDLLDRVSFQTSDADDGADLAAAVREVEEGLGDDVRRLSTCRCRRPRCADGRHARARGAGRAGPPRDREALRPRPGVRRASSTRHVHEVFERGAGLPHRPLPGQGGRAEHPGAALRQRPLRARLEPTTTSPRCRSTSPRRWRWRAAARSTSPPARFATWSPPTCARSSASSPRSRRSALDATAVRRREGRGLRRRPAARPRRASCSGSTRATATRRTWPTTPTSRPSWRWRRASTTTAGGRAVPAAHRQGDGRRPGAPSRCASARPTRRSSAATYGARDELVLELTDDGADPRRPARQAPGPEMELVPATLRLDLGEELPDDEPLEAYERLLLDVMPATTRCSPVPTRLDGCGRCASRCSTTGPRRCRTPRSRGDPAEALDLPEGGWRLGSGDAHGA